MQLLELGTLMELIALVKHQRERERERERHTDRHRDKQTSKRTERQTDRRSERPVRKRKKVSLCESQR